MTYSKINKSYVIKNKRFDIYEKKNRITPFKILQFPEEIVL